MVNFNNIEPLQKEILTMQTDSDKKRNTKYKAEKTKLLSVRFYPTDMELLDYVKSQDNVAQYVKGLIREDMERSKQ